MRGGAKPWTFFLKHQGFFCLRSTVMKVRRDALFCHLIHTLSHVFPVYNSGVTSCQRIQFFHFIFEANWSRFNLQVFMSSRSYRVVKWNIHPPGPHQSFQQPVLYTISTFNKSFLQPHAYHTRVKSALITGAPHSASSAFSWSNWSWTASQKTGIRRLRFFTNCISDGNPLFTLTNVNPLQPLPVSPVQPQDTLEPNIQKANNLSDTLEKKQIYTVDAIHSLIYSHFNQDYVWYLYISLRDLLPSALRYPLQFSQTQLGSQLPIH